MKLFARLSKQSIGFVAGLTAGLVVVGGVGVAFAVTSAPKSEPQPSVQPSSPDQSTKDDKSPEAPQPEGSSDEKQGSTPNSSSPSQSPSSGRNTEQPSRSNSGNAGVPQPAPAPAPAPSGPTPAEIAAIQAEREWYNLEIQNSQARIATLQADLELRQYWLSVANAYSDTLRANQLNAEILTIEANIANENAFLNMITAQRDALPNY